MYNADIQLLGTMARKFSLPFFLVGMSALALLLVAVAANSRQVDSSMSQVISANESVNPAVFVVMRA